MAKFTGGPWLWGTWTIRDEDRAAQRRGEPYWSFVDNKDQFYDENCLAQGPYGRKAMTPNGDDVVLYATGVECDGIEVSKANARLIAHAPEMYDWLVRVNRHGPVQGITELLKKIDGEVEK